MGVTKRRRGSTAHVVCHNCGAPFSRALTSVTRGAKAFCSRNCSVKWNAKNPRSHGMVIPGKPIGKHRNTDQELRRRILNSVEPCPSSWCWIWMQALDISGYGVAWDGQKNHKAHRLAYEVFRGSIPENMQLDHVCQLRSCANPWHMEPVTPAVNTMRSNGPAAINARKTHCKRGHEFTKSNTHIDRKGKRVCRSCYKIKRQNRAHGKERDSRTTS